jgi:hypothetical protein
MSYHYTPLQMVKTNDTIKHSEEIEKLDHSHMCGTTTLENSLSVSLNAKANMQLS